MEEKINIDYVLSRGVASVLPTKNDLKALMKKKKITLYQGFDPSSKSLHLGNFIGIRKLAQFQKLGHKVIFLVGDFTGMIGDPTDKNAARKKLTHQQVLENAQGWKDQVKGLIKLDGNNPVEFKFNSSWLAKLKFEDVLELASNFTVQQMLERDFFQERLKKEKPIHLHEFLYPLMQGYDSVFMGVDLEIGGNDQLFNMLAGRTLTKILKEKEKYVLTLKLLQDPSGEKMGKSVGNTINLTDSNTDIFGKIMSMPDSFTKPGFELLTDLSLSALNKLSPIEAKKHLAFNVVKQIHGEKKAEEAKNNFEKTFQKKAPEYKKTVKAQKSLSATISSSVGSTSEAKRLIKQGAVDVNEKTIKDPTHNISGGDKIKIGKKVFIKTKKIS